MRYFEVEIYGNGGEYTLGVINEEEKKEYFIQVAEEEELTFNGDDDADVDFETACYENDSYLHIYGLNMEDVSKMKIYETKDKEAKEYLNDNGSILELSAEDINYRVMNNPYVEKNDDNENDLLLLGIQGEKDMYVSYMVETEKDFNIGNLILGTTLLDESFQYSDDILDEVFYFEKDKFLSWLRNKEKSTEKIDQIIFKSYLDYKKELEEEYEDILGEFFAETIDTYKNEMEIDTSIMTSETLIFEDFRCEISRDPEGTIHFEEVKLRNMDNEDIE